MGNEIWVPTNLAGTYVPFQAGRAIVASGAHLSFAIPGNPSVFIATALDVGIVAAVTSGYFQFYDSYSGQTIWVDEIDTPSPAYASWRGAYIFEYPNEAGHLEVYNNTTSAAGVSLFGWCWNAPSQDSWGTNLYPPT